MKKILAISVAFMYLAITSGLVLQVHYCMGRQSGASVRIADTVDHTCGTCGMKNGKNKCCHDEVTFIRLQDVHKQVAINFQFTPPPATAQEFNFINPLPLPGNCTPAFFNNSPPGYAAFQPPLFILHGVFRI